MEETRIMQRVCPLHRAIVAIAAVALASNAGCVSPPTTPSAAAARAEPAKTIEALPAIGDGEARIALFWNEKDQKVIRHFGTSQVLDDADLEQRIAAAKRDHEKVDHSPFTLTIDAAGTVPWADIVAAINLCKRCGVEKLEFAFGTGK
jgi:hypothetical protein